MKKKQNAVSKLTTKHVAEFGSQYLDKESLNPNSLYGPNYGGQNIIAKSTASLMSYQQVNIDTRERPIQNKRKQKTLKIKKLQPCKTLKVLQAIDEGQENEYYVQQAAQMSKPSIKNPPNKTPADWEDTHRHCKRPHLAYSQGLNKYAYTEEEKEDESKDDLYPDVEPLYNKMQTVKKSTSQARLSINTNSSMGLTQPLSTKSGQFMVSSTLNLKNEIKLLRTFNVDIQTYQSMKNDDEKRSYLLMKMEEDMRQDLTSLDKTLTQNIKSNQEATESILSKDSFKKKDDYKWLSINTRHKGMEPKLKNEIISQYSTIGVRDELEKFTSDSITEVDSINFIVPVQTMMVDTSKRSLIQSVTADQKMTQKLTSSILVSGVTLQNALNLTFQRFVNHYKTIHEDQQKLFDSEKSGRFIRQRLFSSTVLKQKEIIHKSSMQKNVNIIDQSVQKQQKLEWNKDKEENYRIYRKQMRVLLGDMTKESAWDNIMVGAFLKLFHDTPQLSEPEEFQNLKKMNFKEVTEFLSTLPSFNNCLDKKDLQYQVNSMDALELHRVETDIADRILEEYEKQKQLVKEARFTFLNEKNTETLNRITEKNEKRVKEEAKKKMKDEFKLHVKRIKAILHGLEKKILDIKKRVYPATDRLYKDRLNWSKKSKAYPTKFIYDFYMYGPGLFYNTAMRKFDPDEPEQYFQEKYTGGPVEYDQNRQQDSNIEQLKKLGFINYAAKKIQHAYKRHLFNKKMKEKKEQENKNIQIRNQELKEKTIEIKVKKLEEFHSKFRKTQTLLLDECAKLNSQINKVPLENQNLFVKHSPKHMSSSSQSQVSETPSDSNINESDTDSNASETTQSVVNQTVKRKKKHQIKKKKQLPLEFKHFSFFIRPDKDLVYCQSGGTEKIFESRIVDQNKKIDFIPTLDGQKRRRLSKYILTARQENIIKCAKTNNVTYNKDVITTHDLNVRDNKNNTALFYAVSNGYFDVSKVLLDLGSNINSKNCMGNSALHKAFMSRNMLIINLLLNRGANITQMNDLQQTALYYAPVSMIKELGLSRYVTHYMGYHNFEAGFKESKDVKDEIKRQEEINKRIHSRLKY